ncbi:hypothetical protein [Nocardia seriolae]|nr:hypothetical protein [Nocardia seriolae]APA98206.1 hypothetical protein NS506_04158 [Nocardia seriolae]MTJ62892.1 hypothetical protein [Nocardia seriolae]MTJ72669.1 hypothetical protein [Nocardia seriolae]MTJ87923.1 hypothetical protein [Nocardia seriolae]MTK31914.1 hypothetical protein [Nocardia seriolae]
MASQTAPVHITLTVDPVVAHLIIAAAELNGVSASAVVSQLARRHLLADYAPVREPGDEVAEAVIDIEIDRAAACADSEEGPYSVE